MASVLSNAGHSPKCPEQCRIGDKGQEVSITLNEGVIVSTALYGAEACGMRSDESLRRKVSVLEIHTAIAMVRTE